MGLNESQNGSLFFLLGYLSRFSVCSGVAVDNRNEAVVRRENDNICPKVRLGNLQEVFVSKKKSTSGMLSWSYVYRVSLSQNTFG